MCSLLYQKVCAARRMIAHFCSMNYLRYQDDQRDSTIEPDLNLKNDCLADTRSSSSRTSAGKRPPGDWLAIDMEINGGVR
jgi:hypothetical protein